MTATGQQVTVWTGDDVVIPYHIVTENGAPENLTLFSQLSFAVRDKPDGAYVFPPKTLLNGITKADLPTARVEVAISREDTLHYAVGGSKITLYCELQGVRGGFVRTLAEGPFVLHQSVVGVAPPGPIDPSSVAGLKLWLKSDTGVFQDSAMTTPATASTHPVGGWQDQSGAGNHLTQSTSTRRPTLYLAVQGGYAGIKSDGVDDSLYTTTATGLAANSSRFTIVLVLRTVGLDNQALVNIGGGSNGVLGKLFRIHDSSGTLDLLRYTQAVMGISTGQVVASTPYVLTVTYGSPLGSFYINGVEAGSINVPNTFAPAATQIYAFAQENGAILPFPGHLLEVVYYDQRIPDSDLLGVHDWLGTKYGLF